MLRQLLSLLIFLTVLSPAANAALVLNVDAKSGTMEWASGQTTFTANADLSFQFGSSVGSIIRFTAPEPQRTKDFDNGNGMIMEITTLNNAIVGIKLFVIGTVDSDDGSFIGGGSGASAPTFSSGYSFNSFGSTASGKYS